MEETSTEDIFIRRLSIFTNVAVLATILIITLQALESVFQPFFIAMAIYFVMKPGADALSGNGFPVLLSYLTMLMLFILVIVTTAFIAYSQVSDFTADEDRMDEYDENLQHKWRKLQNSPLLGEWLGDADENGSVNHQLTEAGVVGPSSFQTIFVGALSAFGGMLTTFVTVLFFLIFIIFEANSLPSRIAAAFPGEGSSKVEVVVERIEESINKYVIVKTGVSLGTAVCSMLIMWLFGVDLWFLWGMLTFLFNYVPYIGSLLATIPPLILGLAILPGGVWLMLLVLLLVNQQVWGNIIETKWTGSQLDISPVLLLLVVAFAFWLWGILGMVLSVPLFVILKIVLENIPSTHSIAILMSETAPDFLTAYESALSDGLLTDEEKKMLSDLQSALGLTSEEGTRIAKLAAVNLAIEQGELSGDMKRLVIKAGHALLEGKDATELETALDDGVFGEKQFDLIEVLREKLED